MFSYVNILQTLLNRGMKEIVKQTWIKHQQPPKGYYHISTIFILEQRDKELK